jgi:hypothetical protein
MYLLILSLLAKNDCDDGPIEDFANLSSSRPIAYLDED